MAGYDFERPIKADNSLILYVAVDVEVAKSYGKYVKATDLTNSEYDVRFNKLRHKNKMKPPPSCGRIFPGYLVIRNLDTPSQYETWIPDHVFEDIYKKHET